MVPQCCLHREEFRNTSEISSFLGNSIEFFPRRLLNMRGGGGGGLMSFIFIDQYRFYAYKVR